MMTLSDLKTIVCRDIDAAREELVDLCGRLVAALSVNPPGRTAEVAQVVLWLCSGQSSFVTGTVVPIDGGQSAGNKPPQMYRQGQPMQARPADG